jgi:hypothetical protein
MNDASDEIEAAAWGTSLVQSVLLTDSGKRRKDLPYLAFRALDRPSGKLEFERLRVYVRASRQDQIEFDISKLLKSINWRLHGIASAALLVSTHNSELLLHRLWKRLYDGSAVAPALCASASMIDPNFAERAHALLEEKSCFHKTTVALDALLELIGADRQYSDQAREHIVDATREDQRLHQSSGKDAIYWREDASACLAAA